MKVRRLDAVFIGVSVLALTGFATQTHAGGVNLNVGVFAPLPVVVAPATPPDVVYATPPAYAIQEPPQMVVIPGTYVYAVPDAGISMVFYQGYWWRPYGGHWYRAASYNGTWAYARTENVPPAVKALPPDYHRHLPNGARIAHADVQRNWKSWERERRWDRNDNRDREGGHTEHDRHSENR